MIILLISIVIFYGLILCRMAALSDKWAGEIREREEERKVVWQ